MANVMTTKGTLACSHGGKATLTSSAKLKIQGAAVLLYSDVIGWPIALCAQTDASNSQVPCTAVQSPSAGQSKKLKVGGVAVVLDDLGGQTNGKPQSTFTVGAGQSKFKSV